MYRDVAIKKQADEDLLVQTQKLDELRDSLTKELKVLEEERFIVRKQEFDAILSETIATEQSKAQTEL